MAVGGQHPLADTDWSDLYRRLVVYAVSLTRVDRVIEGTGKSAVDLAGDVILQLLQGKIRYDRRQPLLPLLKTALYHDFLDLKKSAGHQTTVILEAGADDTGEIAGGLDRLPAPEEPQSDVLLRRSAYAAIGDDQKLRDYVCAVLECGASTPAEIASLIGISTDEVENRRKRLRRRLACMRARPEA